MDIIIAIEGIDGTGKTTQAKLLCNKLNYCGVKATCIRPIYFPLELMRLSYILKMVSPRKGRTLKHLNKSDINYKDFFYKLLGYPYALFSVFLIKLLNRSSVVVCDRYYYQFLFDCYGCLSKDLLKLFPKPDFVFMLSGDLDQIYSRMINFQDANTDRDYFVNVLKFYDFIRAKYEFDEISIEVNRDEITLYMYNKVLYQE